MQPMLVPPPVAPAAKVGAPETAARSSSAAAGDSARTADEAADIAALGAIIVDEVPDAGKKRGFQDMQVPDETAAGTSLVNLKPMKRQKKDKSSGGSSATKAKGYMHPTVSSSGWGSFTNYSSIPGKVLNEVSAVNGEVAQGQAWDKAARDKERKRKEKEGKKAIIKQQKQSHTMSSSSSSSAVSTAAGVAKAKRSKEKAKANPYFAVNDGAEKVPQRDHSKAFTY